MVWTLCARLVCLLLALSVMRAHAQAQQPPLVDLATAYVHRFVDGFSNVVAEEVYSQRTTSPQRRRVLRSEFLLVRYPGAEEWHSFRDVLEVDGKPVRDGRQEQIVKLFLEAPADAVRRADEIARAGSRYNLRDVGSLNHPLRPLAFLQVAYRDRFRFTPLGLERELGPRIRIVRFEELAQPTIMRSGATGGDLPTHGSFWIDEQTGRVVKTELRVGPWGAVARLFASTTITTLFAFNQELGIDVPVEMRDFYPGRDDDMHGVATYSRFRRFQVRTDTELQK
jgi:hypothetical protein